MWSRKSLNKSLANINEFTVYHSSRPVTDVIHVETMHQNLGLTDMSENFCYIINYLSYLWVGGGGAVTMYYVYLAKLLCKYKNFTISHAVGIKYKYFEKDLNTFDRSKLNRLPQKVGCLSHHIRQVVGNHMITGGHSSGSKGLSGQKPLYMYLYEQTYIVLVLTPEVQGPLFACHTCQQNVPNTMPAYRTPAETQLSRTITKIDDEGMRTQKYLYKFIDTNKRPRGLDALLELKTQYTRMF